MKNLLLFVFVLLFCRCSLFVDNREHNTDQERLVTCLTTNIEKDNSSILNGGLLIYPIELDSLSLCSTGMFDICLLNHDTLVVYKYDFPVIEGLPVKPYESCNLDSLLKIMAQQGYSCVVDADMLYFRNDSTTFWFGFNVNPTEFVDITTTSRLFAFDSVRVGDPIANTSLFSDLWKLKQLSNSIHYIHINSTYFYNQNEWHYPWANLIKKSDKYYVLEFTIDNGIVSKCSFGVQL